MNRTEVRVGLLLIGVGILVIIGYLLGISFFQFVCSISLITAGLAILFGFRPGRRGTRISIPFVGDIRRSGDQAITSEDIWLIAGDLDLDFTNIQSVDAPVRIRIFGFAHDAKIRCDESTPLEVVAYAFVTDYRLPDRSGERIFSPLYYQNPAVGESTASIHVETWAFANSLKVERTPSSEIPAGS
jgi:hypothetical protein